MNEFDRQPGAIDDPGMKGGTDPDLDRLPPGDDAGNTDTNIADRGGHVNDNDVTVDDVVAHLESLQLTPVVREVGWISAIQLEVRRK